MKKLFILLGFFLSSWHFYAQRVSSNGFSYTPRGQIRRLIIFLGDENDNVVNPNWPLGQLPNWADEIVESDLADIGTRDNLSTFYNDMSLGQFQFVGDVYPEFISLDFTLFQDTTIRVDTLGNIDTTFIFREYRALQAAINEIVTTDPDFDWALYDQRKNTWLYLLLK